MMRTPVRQSPHFKALVMPSLVTPCDDAKIRLLRKFMAICRILLKRKSMKSKTFKSKLMPEISAENASLIHAIAMSTAIIAALISACAVILAQLMSDVQIKQSDRSMAEAGQLIPKADESSAQSQLKIDALIQQNQALTARLAAEEQARLKIEARLQPRKLTAQAQAAFKALAVALAKDKVTPTVLLNIVKNDDEALAFSKQIAVAMMKAGVRVQIKHLMHTKDATGAHVVLYNSPGSQHIEHAFIAANIASQITRSSQTPKIRIDDQDTPAISAFITVYPRDLSLSDTTEPPAR